ncbi:unnamed protein product [Penicillium pancosmium]
MEKHSDKLSPSVSTAKPSGHLTERTEPPTTNVPPEKETLKVLHDQIGEAVYTDPSHWMSILQEIKFVRESLPSEESSAPDETPHLDDEPDFDLNLNMGPGNKFSISDALTCLPVQPVCDMLLSKYFNSRYMVLGIVHYGKFRKEYEEFWNHPQRTSFRWLALLFSILSVAITCYDKASPANGSTQGRPSAILLQQTTARCLISGGYGTAKEYSIEALFLYLQSRFMNETSSTTQLWLELGTIIRLALRMGYHRDPDGLPSISIFEGEMRRRVWLNIFQIDALVSFQMGLPSMLPAEYCDTKPPGNFHDTDLSTDMDQLPNSRSLEEGTPLRYGIVKCKIMSVFKKIVSHTQPLSSPEYSATLALDREMKNAYEAIPDVMKRRNISDSFIDASDVIMERCTLELLYLKGIVVLHRRYIRHEPHNLQFEPSRRFCLEAALEILARQADIYNATLFGGRLHEDAYMVTTLTEHDFLLAAMVVCLDLSVQIESEVPEISNIEGSESFTAKKFHALQTSQQIWAAKRGSPSHSHIALITLDLMIRKVTERQASIQNTLDESSHDKDPWMGVGLPYIQIGEMIDGSEAVDWSLLDQLFQNQVMETMQ